MYYKRLKLELSILTNWIFSHKIMIYLIKLYFSLFGCNLKSIYHRHMKHPTVA